MREEEKGRKGSRHGGGPILGICKKGKRRRRKKQEKVKVSVAPSQEMPLKSGHDVVLYSKRTD